MVPALAVRRLGFVAFCFATGCASEPAVESAVERAQQALVVTASYDSVLKAPKCVAGGSECDTGPTLINGRGPVGPEQNASNTLQGSCPDGTSGRFHSDESLDRLRIATTDGAPLAAGKAVIITATVWAYAGYTSDKLDLYFAPNANAPVWTLITTLTPPGSGARTMTASYTIPTNASLPAVRANFRWGGAAAPCVSGSYNDRDDLVFMIAAGSTDAGTPPPPVDAGVPVVDAGSPLNTPPQVTIVSPSASTVPAAPLLVTVASTDSNGVSHVKISFGPLAPQTFYGVSAAVSASFNLTGLAAGTYTLSATATDTLGVATTVTKLIQVLPNAVPTVSFATSNASVAHQQSVYIPVSANDSDGTVSKVCFFLDGAPLPGGCDTFSPFAAWVSTYGVSVGMHTLTAQATDSLGAASLFATLNLQVLPNSPPVLHDVMPMNGATVSGVITISAGAWDPQGSIPTLQLQLPNGSNLWSSGSISTTFDTNLVPNGNAVFVITAADPGGYTSSQTISVTVSNVAAVVDGGIQLLVADDPGAGLIAHPAVISNSGEFVALATNLKLLPADQNSAVDVYLLNRQTNQLSLINVPSQPTVPTTSTAPDISADGRYVVYRSNRPETLSPAGGVWNIYRYDRMTGVTTLVTERVSTVGTQPTSQLHALSARISPDGRYIVYVSAAKDIAGVYHGSAGTNVTNVFVFDTVTNITTRLNTYWSSYGVSQWVEHNGNAVQAVVRSNGDVVFVSHATNLVADDTNNTADIFYWSAQNQTYERINVSNAGVQANDTSVSPYGSIAVTDDGRYVAFNSKASNLVAGDTNGAFDVFLRDRLTGITTRVSTSSTGAQASARSEPTTQGARLGITADGRHVVFESEATNLASGAKGIFSKDTLTGAVARVDRTPSGAAPTASGVGSCTSANGQQVLFWSDATNLVPNDVNGATDLFLTTRP